MAEFVPNPAGIAFTRWALDGPVGTDLAVRTIRVDALAKQLCPVDTGRLRSSIRFWIRQVAANLDGFVGTDVNYAMPVHEGIKNPAFITPVHKQALFWPGADHPVGSVQQKVRSGNPFLAKALIAAGGSHTIA